MITELKVTSSRIGGNPGGKCIVKCDETFFSAYYKFCYGSKLSGNSPFRAPNQPVYEALTFDLARKLGLQAPSVFVLLNERGDVKFTDWKRFSEKGNHDPSGRRCYFVSRLTDHPVRPEADPISNRILEAHRPYLESLLIADIINIKQNYALVGTGLDADIRYLDLGCSFVHAKGGFLLQQNRTRKETRSFKEIIKGLNHTWIANVQGTDILNVGDFIRGIPSSGIPTLNPWGVRIAKTLLSAEELEGVMKLIAQGFESALPDFKLRDLLIKSK